MKTLISIKYIGLVNLVLGTSIGSQPIVKEFIQPSYSDQVDIMVELNRLIKMNHIENQFQIITN
jgi:lipid A disaccharide synthetase